MRARFAAGHSGFEAVVGGQVEAGGFFVFGRVALHHGDGVQHLGGYGARVRNAVLAGAGQFAHLAAKVHGRHDDEHQRAQHLQHHPRVGPNQHRQCANTHHQIAQTHGERRANDGLHQRGVGRQARQHFAGLCGFKKLWALAQARVSKPRCECPP